MMKVSVLVNSYNYQQYVLEAIASALNQTHPPDEVIVVDDGSTDGSPQHLRDHYANHDRVRLILKDKNEGHLACISEGFKAASGDLLFFLDADDLYSETYLEEAVKFYTNQPNCDFLICDFEMFGHQQGRRADYKCDRDLGYSIVSTFYRKRWLGSITTAISIRRNAIDPFFPFPYLDDWIYRADSCLVYASSLLGARKFYIAKPLIKYRLHGKNWSSVPRQGRAEASRLRRLFAYCLDMRNDSDNLAEQAEAEFRSIDKPFYRELRMYLNIVQRQNIPTLRKVKMALVMLTHFLLRGDYFSPVPEWHL